MEPRMKLMQAEHQRNLSSFEFRVYWKLTE